MEGMSESLAKEVHPSWNIKLTIIEFGAFKTHAEETIAVIPEHPAYDKPDSATKFMPGFLNQGGEDSFGDPEKAARELHKIAYDDTLGLRVPLGLGWRRVRKYLMCTFGYIILYFR